MTAGIVGVTKRNEYVQRLFKIKNSNRAGVGGLREEKLMDKNNLLKLAIEIYGEDAQIMMAIEECSELIQAICKFYRDPDTYMRREAVIDEIADVTIMCEQLRLIFGAELVDKRKEYKLKRLETRMNDTVNSGE